MPWSKDDAAGVLPARAIDVGRLVGASGARFTASAPAKCAVGAPWEPFPADHEPVGGLSFVAFVAVQLLPGLTQLVPVGRSGREIIPCSAGLMRLGRRL